MASRAKQLDEVKAALAALQEEIQEEKKKVNRAEERLEKAILEGNQVDVRADLKVTPFEKLYEGAVANLTRLGQEKAELLKRETILIQEQPAGIYMSNFRYFRGCCRRIKGNQKAT
jgi:FKBP-type peptidyl-prolyl cis-trans isomerase (trigger factor)